jgi:four helix bundle protein
VAGARSHEELIVWQLAHELKLKIYSLIDGGPIARHVDLCDQLRRSGSSAPRNIAEGFGRYLPGHFIHYLRIANGELRETCDALQDACDRRLPTGEEILPLIRTSLFRPVPPRHIHIPLFPIPPDRDLPRVAAHFTVNDERALHVGLEIDLARFAAIGTLHGKALAHH